MSLYLLDNDFAVINHCRINCNVVKEGVPYFTPYICCQYFCVSFTFTLPISNDILSSLTYLYQQQQTASKEVCVVVGTLCWAVYCHHVMWLVIWHAMYHVMWHYMYTNGVTACVILFLVCQYFNINNLCFTCAKPSISVTLCVISLTCFHYVFIYFYTLERSVHWWLIWKTRFLFYLYFSHSLLT